MSSPDRIIISSDVTLQTLDDYLLPEAQKINDRCLLDLSDASFISAPGGAVILLFLHYLKSKRGKEIIILPPKSEKTLGFLSHMRFWPLAQKYL